MPLKPLTTAIGSFPSSCFKECAKLSMRFDVPVFPETKDEDFLTKDLFIKKSFLKRVAYFTKLAARQRKTHLAFHLTFPLTTLRYRKDLKIERKNIFLKIKKIIQKSKGFNIDIVFDMPDLNKKDLSGYFKELDSFRSPTSQYQLKIHCCNDIDLTDTPFKTYLYSPLEIISSSCGYKLTSFKKIREEISNLRLRQYQRDQERQS